MSAYHNHVAALERWKIKRNTCTCMCMNFEFKSGGFLIQVTTEADYTVFCWKKDVQHTCDILLEKNKKKIHRVP